MMDMNMVELLIALLLVVSNLTHYNKLTFNIH